MNISTSNRTIDMAQQPSPQRLGQKGRPASGNDVMLQALDSMKAIAGEKGETEKKDSFQHLYSRVSAENRRAESGASSVHCADKQKNSVSRISSPETEIDDSPDTSFLLPLNENPLVVEGEYTDGPILPGQTNPEVVAASSLIFNTIKVVSESLQITVGQNIDSDMLIHPTEGVIEQLVEMVSALEDIAAVLEQSVGKNLAVHLGNDTEVLPEPEAVRITVRKAIFHIEYALSMLGVSGEAASAIASKQGHEASIPVGLPLAVNPDDVSMQPVDIRRFFGELINEKEREIGTAIERLIRTLQNRKTEVTSPQIFPAEKTAAGGEQVRASSGGIDAVMNLLTKADIRDLAKQEFLSDGITLSTNGRASDESTSTMRFLLSSLSISNAQIAALSGQSMGAEGATTAPSLMQPAPLIMPETGDAVMHQLMSRLHTLAGSGATEIRIQLRPPTLGQVHIKIEMESDIIVGKLRVENQQVKQIVENNLPALRNALAEQGIKVGSFAVDVDTGEYHESDDAETTTRTAARGDESGGVDATAGGEPDSEPRLGIDTGRRYGSNSIEYYA